MKPTVHLLALSAGLVLVSACGGPERRAEAPTYDMEAGLKELGELFKYLAHEQQPPPAKLEDLSPRLDALPNAWGLLQNGQLVLFYGVGAANTPTIVAHDKDAATQGGFVLLRDGTVKRMSAAEFQAAPKARR